MPENSNQERNAIDQPNESSIKPRILNLLRSLKRRVQLVRGYGTFISGLFTSYWYDIKRYHRAASKGYMAVCFGESRYTELKSWIAADAHKIEKGMALRAPRPGFGRPVVRRLVEQVERFHRDFGPEPVTEIAINTLTTYCAYSQSHGIEEEALLADVARLSSPLASDRDHCMGGVIEIDREIVLQSARFPGAAAFFNSRYSIRNFSDEPVSMDVVEKAIALAQKTPSVCNRQSWKAYVFLDGDEPQQVLACQQGNRGFGDTAAGALVITSDLETFFSYGERNQGYIDGGMFAMSVVYGLHAQGVGSCCLNWCVDISLEKELRTVAEIPEHEAVIMMIAIGHLPASVTVAQSVRKPLADVCIPGRLRSSGGDSSREGA